MNFNELASILELLEREPSRVAMTKTLAQLFNSLDAHEAQIVAYFCTGVLQPPYKNITTNIAEKLAIKAVSQVLAQSHDDVENELKKVSDLGELIGAQGKWESREHVSVVHVYDQLLKIAQESGSGSQEAKVSALAHLLKNTSPLAAKFIIRIVLGTLRLGFSDMTIIDSLSWLLAGDKSLSDEIERAYSACADIGLIARTVKESGITGINNVQVTVGIPVRPAAAERLGSAQEIIDKIGSCVAEPKLDGFRLQVHIDKTHVQPKIYFFSRNLTDMSSMYPDLMHALEHLDVHSVIIEGEAIGYDPDTGSFLPFQETVKRKRKHDIAGAVQELPLQLFLFDILYYNGHDVLGKPLTERRALLKKICSASKIDHTIIRVDDQVHIKTAQELEKYFLEQVNSGLEGVVVKRPDGIYQPGKRNFNWIKLKRLEKGHLLDTIDCAIVGYYAGSGKRASFGVGALLVAVYNEHKDCYQTIAKIGTGFSDQEWRDVKHRCDQFKLDHKPVNIECDKNLYPDVWVSPKIVIEVTADEITQSPVHTAATARRSSSLDTIASRSLGTSGTEVSLAEKSEAWGLTSEHAGLALRFPRFVRYRDDKLATEATSVHEVQRLFAQQRKK